MDSKPLPATLPPQISIPRSEMWYLGDRSGLSKEDAWAKHQRVGELLRQLHCIGRTQELTGKLKNPEHWTGLSIMRPGLEVKDLEDQVLIRMSELAQEATRLHFPDTQ